VSRVKKYEGQVAIFSRPNSCKFPTEIMGAQNFNFAPNFPKMGVFSLKLYLVGRIFSDTKSFFSTYFRQPKI